MISRSEMRWALAIVAGVLFRSPVRTHGSRFETSRFRFPEFALSFLRCDEKLLVERSLS